MKKLALLVTIPLLTVIMGFIEPPVKDTVTLVHTYYTTTFSKKLLYPVLVTWWDTKARVGCQNKVEREDKFIPDPDLPEFTDLIDDYKGSGTDRGHMCPAADNQCLQGGMAQCFYFSNMAPQYHSLNAGDWKTLEERTRDLAVQYDSVMVWCGSLGVAKKIGRVSVPINCWKVIYVKKTKTYEAYMFNNTKDKPKGIEACKVKVSDVEKATGFKFTVK